MEIGKIGQVTLPAVANGTPENVEKGNPNGQAAAADGIEKDFQVEVQGIPQKKIAELAQLLQQREKNLQALPENVRRAVQELLQQLSAAQEDLPDGLAALLKNQKNLAEQLNQISNSLENMLQMKAGKNKELQEFIGKFSQAFTAGKKEMPAQIGREVLQMAQQLADQPVATQERLQTLLRQMGEKYLPKQAADISGKYPKELGQLTQSLEGEIPQEFKQAMEKFQFADLKRMWVSLKGADLGRFQELNPQQLRQSAQVLEEAAQWIKDMADSGGPRQQKSMQETQGTAQSQPQRQTDIEKLLQNLPEPVKQALQHLGQRNRQEKLNALAENLKQLANLQGKEDSDTSAPLQTPAKNEVAGKAMGSNSLQDMLGQLAVAAKGKSPFQATEFANEIVKLLKHFSDNQETAFKLKDIVDQLLGKMPQAGSKEGQELQGQLSRLLKMFEPMPPALLETANKYNMPELPKLAALLKALDAQQWKELDQQALAKASASIKELAQQVYKPGEWQADKQIHQQTLSFSLPLYFGDGTIYPAYIHIYQEKDGRAGVQGQFFETWLRISLDTENLGTVNSVFRLYDENKLDVRIGMPEGDGAAEFTDNLSMIREKLGNGKLQLTDFLLNRM